MFFCAGNLFGVILIMTPQSLDQGSCAKIFGWFLHHILTFKQKQQMWAGAPSNLDLDRENGCPKSGKQKHTSSCFQGEGWLLIKQLLYWAFMGAYPFQFLFVAVDCGFCWNRNLTKDVCQRFWDSQCCLYNIFQCVMFVCVDLCVPFWGMHCFILDTFSNHRWTVYVRTFSDGGDMIEHSRICRA